jgi:hypothetical protein
MQASRLRFSAGHLFYFASLSAASIGLFGAWGLPVACFIVLIWWQILAGVSRESVAAGSEMLSSDAHRDARLAHVERGNRAGISKIEGLVGLMMVSMMLGLLMPSHSESDPLQHAATSMRMIAKAVQAYEQHYGGPLPCVVSDAAGRPLHSWRALILPFLGEEKLAAAYRLDEPWDGPNNSRLAKYRPWHYRVYYPQSDTPRSVTSIQSLYDRNAGFVIVEHESAIGNWLEPSQPCQWSEFAHVPAADQGFWDPGFFASDYRGRVAVSNDVTYQIHPSAFPLETLPAEPIRPGASCQLGEPLRQWHLDNAMRLGVFLLFALYPFRWLNQIQRGTRSLVTCDSKKTTGVARAVPVRSPNRNAT